MKMQDVQIPASETAFNLLISNKRHSATPLQNDAYSNSRTQGVNIIVHFHEAISI